MRSSNLLDSTHANVDFTKPHTTIRCTDIRGVDRVALSDADDLREHDVAESTSVSATLLDKARAAIGDPLAAQHVIDEFFYHRCSSMINSCVHVPTLKAQLAQLFSEGAANLISPDELALLLMAVPFRYKLRQEEQASEA